MLPCVLSATLSNQQSQFHNHAQELKVKNSGGPALDLTYKRLAATKASKVWFSYSHNCSFANGAVFHSVCQIVKLAYNELCSKQVLASGPIIVNFSRAQCRQWNVHTSLVRVVTWDSATVARVGGDGFPAVGQHLLRKTWGQYVNHTGLLVSYWFCLSFLLKNTGDIITISYKRVRLINVTGTWRKRGLLRRCWFARFRQSETWRKRDRNMTETWTIEALLVCKFPAIWNMTETRTIETLLVRTFPAIWTWRKRDGNAD